MKYLILTAITLIISCTGPMGPAGENTNGSVYQEIWSLTSVMYDSSIHCWEIPVDSITENCSVECRLRETTNHLWDEPFNWMWYPGFVRIVDTDQHWKGYICQITIIKP